MRTYKLLVAAGLAVSLIAPVMADTPIGTGVTGAGGTGANKSDDPSTGAGPGTEVRGAPRQGAGSNASGANSSAGAQSSAGKGSGATGASAGAGAGASGTAGAGDARGNAKGNVSGGATQY